MRSCYVFIYLGFTVVNRTLPSLQEEIFKITLTVPLTKQNLEFKSSMLDPEIHNSKVFTSEHCERFISLTIE